MSNHSSPDTVIRVEPWVVVMPLILLALVFTTFYLALGHKPPIHPVAAKPMVHSSVTPSITTITPSSPAPIAAPVVTPTVHNPKTMFYTVKAGDNLTVIANWFHVNRAKFYRDNIRTVGTDWNLIFPGQKLRVIV
jgi:nucleoid-associated protein YgaU